MMRDVEVSEHRERGGTRDSASHPQRACQVTDTNSRRGPNQTDVKLADSLGDRAWVCLTHAEEILVTVPTAFIASREDRGIAAFLAALAKAEAI